MFTLHSQLAVDTITVGELPLSQVQLARDSRYPWLILVPRRGDITEIYQLSADDQLQLMHEISTLSRLMAGHFNAHKINVAALGNQVPQLHVHVIARYTTDDAWPGPIWGAHDAKFYDDIALKNIIGQMQALLDAVNAELN